MATSSQGQRECCAYQFHNGKGRLKAKENAALINSTMEKDVVQSFLDRLSEFGAALGSTTLLAHLDEKLRLLRYEIRFWGQLKDVYYPLAHVHWINITRIIFYDVYYHSRASKGGRNASARLLKTQQGLQRVLHNKDYRGYCSLICSIIFQKAEDPPLSNCLLHMYSEK